MSTPLVSPEIVGRELELEHLVEALRGPGSVVLIQGEAGVGKTRLVSELIARDPMRGREPLIGNAVMGRDAFPLGPIVEALARAADRVAEVATNPILGALAPLLPEIADRLPPSPPDLGSWAANQHRLFRALHRVFDQLDPFLLVLEDLHWADDATYDLLAYLVDRLPARSALVVTFRGEDVRHRTISTPRPSSSVTHLSVEPLPVPAVRDLVGGILQTDSVSESFAAYLHEKTSGIPFAIEEVVRLLVERVDIIEMDGVWSRRTLDELSVPKALRDSVLERLTRLQGATQEVLKTASVMGGPVTPAMLSKLTAIELDSLAEVLDEGLASGLLSDLGDRTVVVRHDLTAQAIYESMSSIEIARRHRQVAAHLVDFDQSPSIVVRHLRLAGLIETWSEHALLAVQEMLDARNDVGAFDLLADLVACEELDLDRRVRAAVRLADVALACTKHHEALPILTSLLEREGIERRLRGSLRLSVARVLSPCGDSTEAARQLRICVEELHDVPELAFRAMIGLAIEHMSDGSVTENLEWLERAEMLDLPPDDPFFFTSLVVDRAPLLIQMGDSRGLKLAESLPLDATDGARRVSVRGYRNVGDAALHIGRYGIAARALGDGIALSDELSFPRHLAPLESITLMLDWATGRWDGLEGRCEDCIENRPGFPRVAWEVDLVRGLLHLSAGQVRLARRELASLLGRRELASIWTISLASAGLTRMALAGDRIDSALQLTTSALDPILKKELWPCAGEILVPHVVTLGRSGRVAEAAATTASIARAVEGRDSPLLDAALVACSATIARVRGDLPAAGSRFLEAADHYRDLPRPYDAAQMAELAGECLVDVGSPEGIELMLEALRGFEALGAPWDASRVRRGLRIRGAPTPKPSRSGRKSLGDQLSPREKEIVDLAATGATNRGIANELFLSPKTVELHLTHAMRKLGVNSRRVLISRGASQK